MNRNNVQPIFHRPYAVLSFVARSRENRTSDTLFFYPACLATALRSALQVFTGRSYGRNRRIIANGDLGMINRARRSLALIERPNRIDVVESLGSDRNLIALFHAIFPRFFLCSAVSPPVNPASSIFLRHLFISHVSVSLLVFPSSLFSVPRERGSYSVPEDTR